MTIIFRFDKIKQKTKEEVIEMKNEKSQGITLIALVITIIVLLILAGISIATLTGENGVLTKANTAREETERKDIIERAQIDILAKQSDNLGSLSQKELSDILTEKYGTLSTQEENILDKTLTSKDGKHKIKVNEIWNGKFQESGNSSTDDGYIDFKINETPFRVLKGTTWGDFAESEEAKSFGLRSHRGGMYLETETEGWRHRGSKGRCLSSSQPRD